MTKKLVALLLISGVLFHFIIIAVFNSPLNPIKLRYGRTINSYVSPLFVQNWHLFAPNPATNNNDFYVRAKIREEDGQESTTDWLDLTSYMMEQNQTNRFSPYNTLVRIQRSAVTMMSENDDVLLKLHKKADEIDQAKELLDDVSQEDVMEERTKYTEEVLTRYAQAYLYSTYPDKEIVETQVMLVDTKAVPFSKKDDDNFEPESYAYEFSWQPIQKVTPMF